MINIPLESAKQKIIVAGGRAQLFRVSTPLLFFIFIFSSVFGQMKKDSVTAYRHKRFSISINYQANYCYRTTNNYRAYYKTQEGGGNVFPRHSINSYNEIPKYGFATGISFSFFPTKYLGITIGANYTSNGYKTKVIDTLFTSYNGDVSSFPKTDTSYNQPKLDFSYIYIAFPITIDYVKNFRAFKLIFGGGISINWLRKATANNVNMEEKYKTNLGNKYDSSVEKTHLLYYNLHFGIYYNINQWAAFGVVPTFNYQVNSIFPDNHLYTIGTEIKLEIKL